MIDVNCFQRTLKHNRLASQSFLGPDLVNIRKNVQRKCKLDQMIQSARTLNIVFILTQYRHVADEKKRSSWRGGARTHPPLVDRHILAGEPRPIIRAGIVRLLRLSARLRPKT